VSATSSGLHLASAGSFPRSGDTLELQLLERTIAALARGERTTADLLDAENEMTRRAIADQVKAGLEVITDGQIRWHDPISHIAGKLDNVEIEGLQPFLDANSQFRQPVFTGKPGRRGNLVANEYNFARNALGHTPTPKDKGGKLSIKPVLTGPYTLAKFSAAAPSHNGTHAEFDSLEVRALAYAEMLAIEIEVLAQMGAEIIQVDEPAAVKFPQDWPVLEKSIAILAQARDRAIREGQKVELALYVCSGDCEPVYERLLALPVDLIGLDFTRSAKLADTVATIGSPKPLALGLVDAQNAQLEEPAAIARQIERLMPKIAGQRAYLGPSSGLESLQRNEAIAKLELLSAIRAMVYGGRKRRG
jgi:5-methyltetrahydropteroyltriglutamate--homocysteine methyltransferase